MELFVYSDESGVFDAKHNQFYVYGGLIFLDGKSVGDCSRKYKSIEKMITRNGGYADSDEIKACFVSNKEKYKLFKSLNHVIKFGAVVRQNQVHSRIFENKKSCQRYLDYVYKICLKRALVSLINEGKIIADDVTCIHVHADEHTTATNGRYELQEALEQEFKIGTFNYNYQYFYEPIFKNLKSVKLKLCDSSATLLVRAADIVANNIYYKTINGIDLNTDQLYITYFP